MILIIRLTAGSKSFSYLSILSTHCSLAKTTHDQCFSHYGRKIDLDNRAIGFDACHQHLQTPAMQMQWYIIAYSSSGDEFAAKKNNACRMHDASSIFSLTFF